jgi:hypothetical protein
MLLTNEYNNNDEFHADSVLLLNTVQLYSANESETFMRIDIHIYNIRSVIYDT